MHFIPMTLFFTRMSFNLTGSKFTVATHQPSVILGGGEGGGDPVVTPTV